jgi:hypothetical protein
VIFFFKINSLHFPFYTNSPKLGGYNILTLDILQHLAYHFNITKNDSLEESQMISTYEKIWLSMKEITRRLHEVERHDEPFDTCMWWECVTTRENINSIQVMAEIIEEAMSVIDDIQDHIKVDIPSE